MEPNIKTQIAKETLSLLGVLTSLFFLGLLVVVLCSGLQINPFRETTTSLLISAFAGLIGITAVLFLLNVATNISLIADARIAELKLDARRGGWLKKWLIVVSAAGVLVVSLIFAGTYFSKERYIGVVRAQADEVLSQNKTLLEEISKLLNSGKPADYAHISEINTFLENQRSGLPQLTLIYSGRFEDKLAFYNLGRYFPGEKNTYTPYYFACTRNRDCEYLTRFFSGEKAEVLQKYSVRDDEFYIYVPFIGKESRFVLLFDRTNRFGKLGS